MSMKFANRNSTQISEEQMRRLAPSIFADHAYQGMSEKYQFVPTIDVLRALDRESGFVPVQIIESRPRNGDKMGFAKHQIRLRRHGESIVLGEVFPEIVLVNSHDGSSTYQLDAGLFRLVCSNGMMASNTIDTIRVRHSGKDVIGEVIEGTYRVIEEMPAIIDTVNRQRRLILSERQQLAFATAALQLRYDTTDEAPKPTPEQLLMARRYADNGNDLWSTYNRVQENLVKGGLRLGRRHGRNVTSREVRSVDGDTRLNRSLAKLTAELERIIVERTAA